MYNETMGLLETVSQNQFKKQYASFTQWSSVNNLSNVILELAIFLDYVKKYEYNI